MRRILLAFVFALCSVGANAQFLSGQVLTAAALNGALAAKAPVNNATFTGTTTIPGATITGGTITGLSAPIPLGSGGTGAATQAAALTAILGSSTVPIANGGTNAATATAATSNLQYLQGATGSVARSLTSKFQDVTHVLDFAGCDVTGATDSTACVQNALNALPGGGRVRLNGKLKIASNFTLPAGVTLEGDCVMPGTIGSNASAPYGNLTCGVLMVASTATVNLSAGSGLKSVLLYRSGMTFPAADSSAFAGTAITAAGDDVSLDHVMVLGFNKAFYSSGYQRARIEYMFGDNVNGIEITNALDIPYISHCHMWPFATIATGGAYTNHVRSGTAYYLHDTVDWGKITDSFSWGYYRGININNANSTTILNSGTDNSYSAGPQQAGSIGIVVQGTSQDTRIIGAQTSAQASAGVYLNTNAGLATTIAGLDVWGGTTHGVQIDGGDAVITNSVFGGLVGIVNGVTVNNTASRVTITNDRFGTITTNPINPTVANSTTFVGLNDYGSFATGLSGANMTAQSVASAASLVIPNTGDTFNVTGTTNISTLGAGWAGRTVTLIFSGALTVTSATGTTTSMRLSGATNFTTTANATLTLRHNGVQWYEVGRSN